MTNAIKTPKYVFSQGTRAQLRSIAEAMFAESNSRAPSSARLDWLVAELDDFALHAGAKSRMVIRTSAAAIAAMSRVLTRSFGAYEAIDLAKRIHALEVIEQSAVGMPVFALKAIMCIVYFEHPEVAKEAGHPAIECMKPQST